MGLAIPFWEPQWKIFLNFSFSKDLTLDCVDSILHSIRRMYVYIYTYMYTHTYMHIHVYTVHICCNTCLNIYVYIHICNIYKQNKNLNKNPSMFVKMFVLSPLYIKFCILFWNFEHEILFMEIKKFISGVFSGGILLFFSNFVVMPTGL